MDEKKSMLKQLENEFKNWFIKDIQEDPSKNEKDSEADVYFPRTFFMEALIGYEKFVTEIYQNAAQKFKLFKNIIKSLGLSF